LNSAVFHFHAFFSAASAFLPSKPAQTAGVLALLHDSYFSSDENRCPAFWLCSFLSLSPDEKAEGRGFGFALFSVCHRMKRRRAEALALLFPLSVVEAKAEGGNRTHENLLCRQTQCHCATSAFRAFFRMPSTGFEPAAYCFLLSLKGRMGISHLA
jgi:hypothetical protein